MVLLRLFFILLLFGWNWRGLTLDLRLDGGGLVLLQSRGIPGLRAGLVLLGPVGLDLPVRLRGLFLRLLAPRLRSFLHLRRLLRDYGSRLCRLDCRPHLWDGIWWESAGWLGTGRVDGRRWGG